MPPKRTPGQFYYHDNLPLDADPPSSPSKKKVRQSVVSLTCSSMSTLDDFSVVPDSATKESKRGNNNDNRRRCCCVPLKNGVVIVSLLWIISGLLLGSLVLLRPPSYSPSNNWNLDETLARVMATLIVVAQGVIILGTFCGAITVVHLNATRLLNAYVYFSFTIPVIQGLCYTNAAILYQNWTEFSALIAIGFVSVCISIYFSVIIRAYVRESKTVFFLAGPVSGEVVIV